MASLPIPRVAPDFADALGGHANAQLDQGQHAAYGIWRDGRLAYLNRGWFDFARDNRGDDIPQRWDLGANIWDAIPAPLAEFYARGFESALSSGVPWQHTYECSSPPLLRTFHMLTYPLGAARGLLIVNSLLLEAAHPPAAEDDREATHLDEHGLIRQCVHCRRVRSGDGSSWDWIPRYLDEHPSNMSGSICPPCFSHHYPGAPALPS